MLHAAIRAESVSLSSVPCPAGGSRSVPLNVSLPDSVFRISNLSAPDERRLLEIFHSNAPEHERRVALSALWLSYAKLVVAIAARYRTCGIDRSDLVGAGQLGLHAGIVRFDVSKTDVRLATYAIPWIRYYIQDYIRKNRHPITLPNSNAHRRLFQSKQRLFEDARRACIREGIASPTDNQLCRRVGVRVGLSEYEVERSLQLTGGSHVSFDAATRPDTLNVAQAAASHSMPDGDINRSLDTLEATRRINLLAETILGRTERRVFAKRCMTDDQPARLDELAEELHVTRERIYQLEASAKRKITTALIAEGFAEAGALQAVQSVRSRALRRQSARSTPEASQSPESALQRVPLDVE